MKKTPFRDLLMKAMREKRINRSELARRADLGGTSVVQYLAPGRPVLPHIERLPKIAEAIGEPIEKVRAAWMEQQSYRHGITPALLTDHPEDEPMTDDEAEVIRLLRDDGPVAAIHFLLERVEPAHAESKGTPPPTPSRAVAASRKREAMPVAVA